MTTTGEAAVGSIRAIGLPNASLVIAALRRADTSFERRNLAAALSGAQKGKAVVATLIKLLQHEDSSVRQAAAQSLGELKAEMALDALLAALPTATDDTEAIMLALLCLDEPSGLEAVLALLHDGPLHQRLAAVEAVTRGCGGSSRGYAAREGRERVLTSLLAALAGDPDEQVRALVANPNHMGRGYTNDDRVVDGLIAAAHDPSPLVRAGAIRTIGWRVEGHLDRVVPLITEMMHAPDDEVRKAATYAAADVLRWPDNQAPDSPARELKPAIIEALSDADGWVRDNAMRCLSHVADTSDIPLLTRLLIEDPNRDVRWRAGETLVALDDIGQDALHELDAALTDPSVPDAHRRDVAIALCRWGDGAPDDYWDDPVKWWAERRDKYLD